MKTKKGHARHLTAIQGGLDNNGDQIITTDGVGVTPRQERVASSGMGRAFVRLANKWDNSPLVRRGEEKLDAGLDALMEIDAPGTGTALIRLHQEVYSGKKNPEGLGRVTLNRPYKANIFNSNLWEHPTDDGGTLVLHAVVGAGQTMLEIVGSYDAQDQLDLVTLMATRFGSLADEHGDGIFAKPIILKQIDYAEGGVAGVNLPIDRILFPKDAIIQPNQAEISLSRDLDLTVRDFGSKHGTYAMDERIITQNPDLHDRLWRSGLSILADRRDLMDPSQAFRPGV